MSSIPQTRRIKQFFGHTAFLEVDEEEGDGVDMVALRHAIADDRPVPVSLDVDVVHPLPEPAVPTDRPRRRDDTHWRHQHYSPVLLKQWAEAQARIDRERRREKLAAERLEREREQAEREQRQSERWGAERAKALWAAEEARAIPPPRKPEHPGMGDALPLAAGALILTCDYCPTTFSSHIRHLGGKVEPFKLEMLRVLAREAGWSSRRGDSCPQCSGR